jgi:NAD(P)-dependent dehydrogenase (short-subunit alcohol dehydrogenase family)
MAINVDLGGKNAVVTGGAQGIAGALFDISGRRATY